MRSGFLPDTARAKDSFRRSRRRAPVRLGGQSHTPVGSCSNPYGCLGARRHLALNRRTDEHPAMTAGRRRMTARLKIMSAAAASASLRGMVSSRPKWRARDYRESMRKTCERLHAPGRVVFEIILSYQCACICNREGCYSSLEFLHLTTVSPRLILRGLYSGFVSP